MKGLYKWLGSMVALILFMLFGNIQVTSNDILKFFFPSCTRFR